MALYKRILGAHPCAATSCKGGKRQSLVPSPAAHSSHFAGAAEPESFFLPNSFASPVLCRMLAPVSCKAAMLPFIRLWTSAVITGFSAVPVMLIGIPSAVEGLSAADVLFNLVRIFTPTLLSPLALVT